MFEKVLIANRGEIAVRIIHACRELGISTVAIYSTADADSLHVQLADESVCIGPEKVSDSYLNIKSIIAACEITGADAIHPGFGFLSENSMFAKVCGLCGIKFIGPSPEVINNLGDKITAKTIMQQAGIPVIPGSNTIVTSIDDAIKIANEIGYPVLIKATAGGGGKGIRKVNSAEELSNAFNSAQTEAQLFFGNGGIYIEKFVESPKHIEVQLLADEFGNIIHLGERDCSIQRKNQKFIEEAPCASISDSLRKKLGEASVKAAKACGYFNAGTVEFLVDANENFYFMEVNTRIQVEHGITELISNVDIVQNQLRIANGEKLKFNQEDIFFNGHSIECRINAENPEQNFLPSAGTITELYLPCGNGIRVDNAIYSGYTISPHYDNLLAKIMVVAPTRKEAIAKMMSALTEFIVVGVNTNVDFILSILKSETYCSGNFSTNFLQNFTDQ